MAKEEPEVVEVTNIALMNAAELQSHIDDLEEKHRARMKSLRALYRALVAEEACE